MLTEQRMATIRDLVFPWEKKEWRNEEYHDRDLFLSDLIRKTIDPDDLSAPMWDWLDEDDLRLLARHCEKVGITVEEFREWWNQSVQDVVHSGVMAEFPSTGP
jgi:hypothetical protein